MYHNLFKKFVCVRVSSFEHITMISQASTMLVFSVLAVILWYMYDAAKGCAKQNTDNV